MSKTMSNSKLLLGILGAAAAGVVIGMLIAPEKGEDLRKNLKKTADDWMDEIASWTGKGKEYLEDAQERAMAEADEMKSEAEDGVKGLKENLSKRRS
ncbi:MAG TPA: YtxH domain-containing protein [Cyclobacteriaceae bacterium]